MNALRFIFICVAALAIAILIQEGTRDPRSRARDDASDRASISIAASAAGDPPAELAQRLREAPDYQAFFADFAHAFPADYEMIARRAARASAAGAPAAPDAVMMGALAELRRSRGLLEAKAGNPILDRVFAAQRDVARALAKTDPTLCAQFLYGRTDAAFLAFARRSRPLIAAMGEAAVAAAIDGGASPIDRPAPTKADFDLLAAGLKSRGLDQEEMEVLLNGRTPSPPLSDSKLCASGLVYLDALRALPVEVRARIYAFALLAMAQI